MLYVYMCVTDIMNVLRTGMNMSISRIHMVHINSQVDLVVLLIFIFYVDSGLSDGVFESANKVS